jgi:uncharacterized protein YoxC
MSEESKLNNAQKILARVLRESNTLFAGEAQLLVSRMDDESIAAMLTSMIRSYENEVSLLRMHTDEVENALEYLRSMSGADNEELDKRAETIGKLTADINGKIAVIEDLNDRVVQLSEEVALVNSSKSAWLDKSFENGERVEKLYQAYKNLLISTFKKDRKALMDDSTYRMIQDSISA